MESVEKMDNFGFDEVLLIYRNEDDETHYELIPKLMEFY